MFFYGSSSEGLPPALYRSPTEIRREIREISKRISEAEEMLSVRNIILALVSEWAELEPERWIEELEETVEEARDALRALDNMKETLIDLRSELDEARRFSGL